MLFSFFKTNSIISPPLNIFHSNFFTPSKLNFAVLCNSCIFLFCSQDDLNIDDDDLLNDDDDDFLAD